MGRRRRKNPSPKGGSKKSGFPAWIKPTVSMIVGGGVGLVAMALLPDSIGPYAPAIGVVASKFLGGGGWGKYLATAGVVGGVTFLSRRKTVQVAAGALKAAKLALGSGGGGGGGSETPQQAGDRILRSVSK